MATQVNKNQLTDYWKDAATQTLPDFSQLISTGFAQDGNPVAGQKATLPGAAWFNIMAAVRVSVILAAGKTPSNPPDPMQFLEALQSLGWMTSKSVKTDVLADKSVTNEKLADQAVTIAKIANALLATQSQAEAGTSSDVLMTPLRVKQAIEKALEEDLPKASETQLGGVKITGDDGLTIASDGTLAVDFSQMPTDKFEDLVKSIRVPIWLTGNKSFYVNAKTGVDNDDEGRGMSSSKPWKTLPYALRYVTDNYNLSTYTATIYLAPGDYGDSSWTKTSDFCELYAFQGSGQIIISGNSVQDAQTTILHYLLESEAANGYMFRNITVYPCIKASSVAGFMVFNISKATINYQNTYLNLGHIEKETTANRARTVFGFSNYSFLRVYATNGSQPSGITISYGGTDANITLFDLQSATAQFSADINVISGNSATTESSVFVNANYLGSFRNTNSTFENPGRAPQINVSEGVTVTGTRYTARNNSIISTGGKGENYFPGTVAGFTASGSQYN